MAEGYREALAKVTRIVETASRRGYQLHHKNYRKIYLKHSRNLQGAFLKLRDYASQYPDVEKTVNSIERKLKPVLTFNTTIDEKRRALGSLRSDTRKLDDLMGAEQLILLDNRPYDAFKKILSKLSSAQKTVMLVDSYVDDTVFPLYFEKVSKSVSIQILTKNMLGSFKLVAKKFKSQHLNFEVRVSQNIHDRYLTVDGRVWLIGQSLKDAGNKPLAVVELRDIPPLNKMVNSLWNAAAKVV